MMQSGLAEIKVINNDKNWLESPALRQLNSIAGYKGVTLVVGLPDLHSGRTPVGLAVVSEKHIYPYLIGGDIGCGMGLFQSGFPLKKFKMEKWETRLNRLGGLAEAPGDNPWARESPIADLGSIGGGNHFIEFQCIDEIYDAPAFETLKAEVGAVLILVHTGSRGFGQKIMDTFNNETGYPLEDPKAQEYLALHNQALIWAQRNRALAAARLMGWLGFTGELLPLIDCAHNYLEADGGHFIHRKGAVSSQKGLVVIPGSRGTLTYIVQPTEETAQTAFSLSHGAGRKWARNLCRGRLEKKYDKTSIRRTSLKSRVICHDNELLFQEAPEAYKNITDVLGVLLDYGLIKIVATLRPLITFKG
jgi:release factor H-coupled RctB family protein